MIENFTKYRIAKHCLLLKAVFLLLSLCIVDISFAAEEFPWEIFYPAIIKKSIDNVVYTQIQQRSMEMKYMVNLALQKAVVEPSILKEPTDFDIIT